ncbi:hypothetical protein AAFF_G00432080 [Aldrovandia affinis]|uniref:Uncharacterized protein n=1 Tax=Aldrovandia affinis TaxID=143900 RepID=A0AAD7R3C5_9TELE|nr:hypothetical protein AAFF_G00432080 [Aldrovandia affinis]
MLQLRIALRLQVVNIPAEDCKRKDPRTGGMVILTDLKGNSRDLPDNIQAAQGARVMVTRNLDTEDAAHVQSESEEAEIPEVWYRETSPVYVNGM